MGTTILVETPFGSVMLIVISPSPRAKFTVVPPNWIVPQLGSELLRLGRSRVDIGLGQELVLCAGQSQQLRAIERIPAKCRVDWIVNQLLSRRLAGHNYKADCYRSGTIPYLHAASPQRRLNRYVIAVPYRPTLSKPREPYVCHGRVARG